MMIVKATQDSEAGVMPSNERISAMTKSKKPKRWAEK
jgi:hypothetical protein